MIYFGLCNNFLCNYLTLKLNTPRFTLINCLLLLFKMATLHLERFLIYTHSCTPHLCYLILLYLVQNVTDYKNKKITISKYKANNEPLFKALNIIKLLNMYNPHLYNVYYKITTIPDKTHHNSIGLYIHLRIITVII